MTYETRDLGPETWPDFERLFAPGRGWAFCACMLFQRGCHLPKAKYPNRKAERVQNQAEKRALVIAGQAHGILVYDGGEPIGWCQYGPAEELPLPGESPRGSEIGGFLSSVLGCAGELRASSPAFAGAGRVLPVLRCVRRSGRSGTGAAGSSRPIQP